MSYLITEGLDKRLRQTRGKRRQVVCEYLLKWKGYGHEFNMWYSEDELANCKELNDSLQSTNKQSTLSCVLRSVDVPRRRKENPEPT